MAIAPPRRHASPPTAPARRFRPPAALLALLAAMAAVVPGAAATAAAGSRRRLFGSNTEDEAQSNVSTGVILFGVGLIVTILIIVIVLQFFPTLTSAVTEAQTDENLTTSAADSLDLVPLVLVLSTVFLALGTMFVGLFMIVKAARDN